MGCILMGCMHVPAILHGEQLTGSGMPSAAHAVDSGLLTSENNKTINVPTAVESLGPV